MDSRFVKAFTVGSSLPATIWSLGLTSMSNKYRPCKDYECLIIAISAIFGLLNGILVLFPGENIQRRMFYAGGIFGFLFAFYGTYISDIHCKLLGLEPRYKFLALIWETVFYSLVWGIVIHGMNQMFQLYITAA